MTLQNSKVPDQLPSLQAASDPELYFFCNKLYSKYNGLGKVKDNLISFVIDFINYLI